MFTYIYIYVYIYVYIYICWVPTAAFSINFLGGVSNLKL